MAYSYVPVDRDQPFLLPPDMREWLPASHLVWFVIDVVARVDTSVLHDRHPNDGVGRRAYDPDMLLALLVYAYCTGQRSSRQIERLCQVDVAYRVICANRVPDHTTIARFRQDHDRMAMSLFVDVLVLCATAGLAQVGVVAVDGTKMEADASKDANLSRARLGAEVQAMFAQAAEVDADQDRLFGDTRGDELPDELVDPRSRRARLDAALRQLEAQDQARRVAADAAKQAQVQAEAEAARRGGAPIGPPPRGREVVRAEAALALARQRAAEGYATAMARLAARPDKRGNRPVPPEQNARVVRAEARLVRARQRANERAAKEAAESKRAGVRVNVTDPDSRIMKAPSGWIQGYNAQAAVNEKGVVLAGMVVNDHEDVRQCQPMMTLTQHTLAAAGVITAIGTMLFDAGYWSPANATTAGPDRLIATANSYKLRATTQQQGFFTGPPPADAKPLQAMEHRLQTADGSALYAKRAAIVEPIFGQHKHSRRLRRFARRGLAAVNAEWQLINTTHNIMKLYRAGVSLT